MNHKKWLLASLIIVSVVSASFDGLFYFYNMSEDALTVTIGPILFTILLALWIDADSKEHPEIMRPFEYKFLVWMFLIFYLPYYLLKTRGVAGLFPLAGFVALFASGIIIKLAIYFLYWRPLAFS
jgi:hypothetical protein